MAAMSIAPRLAGALTSPIASSSQCGASSAWRGAVSTRAAGNTVSAATQAARQPTRAMNANWSSDGKWRISHAPQTTAKSATTKVTKLPCRCIASITACIGASPRVRPCPKATARMPPATMTGASTASAKDHVAPSSGGPRAAATAPATDSVSAPVSITASAWRSEPSAAKSNTSVSRIDSSAGTTKSRSSLGDEASARRGHSQLTPSMPWAAWRATAAASGSDPGTGVASTYQRLACTWPSRPARASQSSAWGLPLTLASMVAEAASSMAERPGGERPCSTALSISVTSAAKPPMSGAAAMA